MKCFYCQQEIDENSNFCPFCGRPQSLTCPKCGNKAMPDQKFCTECGTQLKPEPVNVFTDEKQAINAKEPEETKKDFPLPTTEPMEIAGATVGVGRRFLALFIDSMIFFVFNYYFAMSYGTASRSLDSAFSVSYSMEGWPAFVATLIGLGYFVFMEAILGATVGKLIMGIRVIKEDGTKLGFKASFIRNILRIVDLLPGFVPYLLGAILIWRSPTKQRFGDKIAKSLVVKAAAIK